MRFDDAMSGLISHPSYRLRIRYWGAGTYLALRNGGLVLFLDNKKFPIRDYLTAASFMSDEWELVPAWQTDDRPDVWVLRL